MKHFFMCQSVSKISASKTTPARSKRSALASDNQFSIIDELIEDGKIKDVGKKGDNKQIYYSLSESADTPGLDENRSVTFDISSVLADSEEMTDLCLRFDIFLHKNIEIFIFDHIMVVSWIAEFAGTDDDRFYRNEVADLEQALSSIGDYVNGILYALHATAVAASVTKNSKSEVTFRPLWTSRTLFASMAEKDCAPIPEAWKRRWIGELEPSVKSEGAAISVGWGNNFVQCLNKEKSDKIIDLYRNLSARMQNVYAQLHDVNKNISSYFQKLLSNDIREKDIGQLKKLEHEFFNINYSIMEADFTLQGVAMHLFRAYLSAWRIREMVQGMEYKTTKMSGIIAAKLSEKHGAMQKNIRTVLFMIGSIEALGAIVEIIHLSLAPEVEEKYFPGILHFIGQLNPDKVFSGVAVTLALVVVASVIAGISGEKE